MKRERLNVKIIVTDDNGVDSTGMSSIFLDNIMFIWEDYEGHGVIRLLNGEDIVTAMKFQVLDILLDTATQ